MSQVKLNCMECGGLWTCSYEAKSGRTTRYKEETDLPVPDDLEIITCSVCGSESFTERDCDRFDDVLEKAYRARKLKQLVEETERLGLYQWEAETLEGWEIHRDDASGRWIGVHDKRKLAAEGMDLPDLLKVINEIETTVAALLLQGEE